MAKKSFLPHLGVFYLDFQVSTLFYDIEKSLYLFYRFQEIWFLPLNQIRWASNLEGNHNRITDKESLLPWEFFHLTFKSLHSCTTLRRPSIYRFSCKSTFPFQSIRWALSLEGNHNINTLKVSRSFFLPIFKSLHCSMTLKRASSYRFSCKLASAFESNKVGIYSRR